MFSEGVERDQWRDQWNESGLMHSLLQVTLLSCSLMAINQYLLLKIDPRIFCQSKAK